MVDRFLNRISTSSLQVALMSKLIRGQKLAARYLFFLLGFLQKGGLRIVFLSDIVQCSLMIVVSLFQGFQSLVALMLQRFKALF